MGKNQMVPIKELQCHKDLQAPDRNSSDHVSDLTEVVKSGKNLPRVKVGVVKGKPEKWTLDGHHTTEAYEAAGKKQVPASVTEYATWEDLRLAASLTNREHLGLKRSRATKEWQVRMYVTLKPDHAENTVAKAVGVSSEFVKRIRKEMGGAASQNGRVGSDGVVGRTGRPKKDASPAKKPGFNWQRVDEAFGVVSRGVDEVAGLLTVLILDEDKAESQKKANAKVKDDQKKANAALKGLWKILDLWKARLEKKAEEEAKQP